MAVIQYFGVASAFEPWINHTEPGTAFANLRQRNQFATLTNVGLVALWWRYRVPSQATSLAGAAFAVLLGIGNAASSSRTGMVGLVLLALCLWRWSRFSRDGRHVLLAAVVSYAIGIVLLPAMSGADPISDGLFGRFGSDSPACASRLVLWQNVLYLIGERPWTGWGWGELDYAHFATLYDGGRFCDILDNAHNLPLHLAVELGLPVAILVCAGIAWLVMLGRPWREPDAARQMAWAVLGLIGLHSLLEYPLWYGPFQIACCLCIALLVTHSTAKRQVMNRRWPTACAILLFAACTYAAWDYRRISQIYLAPEQRAAAYQANTLEKIRGSWLFSRQVEFAELTLTPLTKDNAAQINRMANDLLHFSPEPKVIEKLIESAVMLGRDDEARFYLARYRAAFPEAHAKWAAQLNSPL
jgi:O-antigen ligase